MGFNNEYRNRIKIYLPNLFIITTPKYGKIIRNFFILILQKGYASYTINGIVSILSLSFRKESDRNKT